VKQIWLVRHAATAWTGERWCGTVDLALSAEGRAEAAALGDRLTAELPPGVAIVASPLRRAVATAAAIADRIGAPVSVEPDLREMAFGDIEGRTFAEIEVDQPAVAAALLGRQTAIDWPGGETAAEIDRRVRSVWARVLARGPSVVVVTHGGILRRLVPLATGDPAAATSLILGPASVTRLVSSAASEGGWRVQPASAAGTAPTVAQATGTSETP
jgi:probable phosphoglycerate mutase